MPTSTGTYDTSTITYDQSSLSYDGFPAPLSNMPAVGVFIAWSGNPYEFAPTGGWTEISQYVRSINIRRGRQDDLQQFPPGTASLVLDNRDRLFDPLNDGRLATRTNLVTNPSFEVNTTGWTNISGATSARLTSDSVYGSACVQVTSSATSYNGIQTTNFIPITGGLSYAVSAYARNISGSTRTVYIALQFYTSAGAYISEINTASQGTLAVGAWTRRWVSGVAPSNATQAKISLLSGTTGLSAGWQTNWDGVLFEQTATLESYFDGSSTDGSWDGVPNNSTSQLKVYRRNLVRNPSFETDAELWGPGNTVTLTRSTSEYLFGTASLSLVSGFSGNIRAIFSGLTGNGTGTAATRISVSAGVSYAWSVFK